MKTPEEIKKGLAICAAEDKSCRDCPYDNGNCAMQLELDYVRLRNIIYEAVYSAVKKAWSEQEGE